MGAAGATGFAVGREGGDLRAASAGLAGDSEGSRARVVLLAGAVIFPPQDLHLPDLPAAVSGTMSSVAQSGQLNLIGMANQRTQERTPISRAHYRRAIRQMQLQGV